MSLVEYRISLKQQLLVLLFTILINTLWIYLFVWASPFTFDLTHGLIFLGCTLFFLLPSIVLHINYLIKNCDGPLVVNANEGVITVGKENKLIQYPISDVTRLTFYSTYSAYSGNLSRLIFDSYRYVKIEIDNKEIIYVTCLMVNEIEKAFIYTFPVSMEKKVKLFPLIS